MIVDFLKTSESKRDATATGGDGLVQFARMLCLSLRQVKIEDARRWFERLEGRKSERKRARRVE